MGINLQKGQKVDLAKNSGLRQIMVGLGWDEAVQDCNGSGQVQSIDCDAAAILCGANGRLVGNGVVRECCIYYGNLTHESGAIEHQGDNLTGEGEGDNEQILVNLSKIPQQICKIVFVVNIYDARIKGQHFGMVRNAFIRLVNMDDNREICRYNLSDNYDNMTGLVVGEIDRKNEGWKFNAIGQPVKEASRLDALINLYR